MIADAGQGEASMAGAATLWLSLSGVPVLFVLVAAHLRGRPVLPARSATFGYLPAAALLLLAFAVYAASQVEVSMIVGSEFGAAASLGGILLVAVMVVILHRRVLRPLMRPVGTLPWRIGTGLLTLWVALPAIYGLVLVLTIFTPFRQQAHVVQIANREGRWQWMVFAAVFVAPVIEEITVRGLIYPAIRSLRGPRVAMILSSIFFGLMHIDAPHAWAPLAVFGVFLAYLVETTGSLAAPIAAHTAFNALTVGDLVVFG